MKDCITVILALTLGVVAGACGLVTEEMLPSDATIYILYVLVLQVGIGLGGNDKLGEMMRGISPGMFVIPLSTIAGTLLFSLAASMFVDRWGVPDCLAVGSGFAYYSLSSVLIVELKGATAGAQVATELGTLALLTNIVREIISLAGAPLFARRFGKFAPISAAGINSMDVLLPSISRYSGKEMVPVAILHGIILEMSVPLLVTLFCRM